MNWPHQSECDAFYGNPRGRNGQASPSWEKANLVPVIPPFQMTYAGSPIKSFKVHTKCAAAMLAALKTINDICGGDKAKLSACGINIFAGSYNYRLMRGSNHLSMHSYGCAIDFDPARNGFHIPVTNFEKFPFVIKAFEDQGAVWGGRWSAASRDGMHFQFATL